MSRVCRTAIDMLKADGIEVGMIRPQTLFPFPEKAVSDAADAPSCTHVVVSIEMSMGQMVEDVERSVKGRIPVSWYGNAAAKSPRPKRSSTWSRSVSPDRSAIYRISGLPSKEYM
jgi:2-oxoglutarate ferredoxin oxidoreductase subunit alpha